MGVTSNLVMGRTTPPISRAVLSGMIMVLALVVLLGIIWFIAPRFFRVSNVVNVLLQASVLGLPAIGMTAVLITGGIDLSLPANTALSAVLGAIVMKATGSATLGLFVMIAVGASLGAMNGMAVAKLKMIPFVVTLSTMTIASGLCVWITNSQSVTGIPTGYLDLFTARPLGVPVTVLVLLAMTATSSVVMKRSIPGYWLYAVGLNAKAAKVARVPVEWVVCGTYVFAGLMAGLTAILLTARLGSASANMGADSFTLDIIAACVVGGVSTFGGVGTVVRAVLGAVLITVLSNAINLAGISFYFSLVIKGFVIIAFVAAEGRWRNWL
jgi:ribose/xylose/arabinose/galactoside ABC-type transport system permease subunit